jgi:hypothetical protein
MEVDTRSGSRAGTGSPANTQRAADSTSLPGYGRQLESQAAEKLQELIADVGEDEDEEEVVEEICDFDRPLRENAMDCCAICGESGDKTKPTEKVFQVEFTEHYLVLCNLHEGFFLRKLLNNYVKRVSKRSKVGFIGPLTKEPVEKDMGPSCAQEVSCGT